VKIKLIAVSRTAQNQEAQAEQYIERLNHYCHFENRLLKPKKCADEDAQRKSDSSQIMEAIKTDDWLVVLDERGIHFSSNDFAGWISDLQKQNIKSIAFVIGGAFGFEDVLIKKAHFKLALSKMTLPHQMARIVLLEQLYRAFTILYHHPYHHA
jgi:23S rRNA (pseudouridine1915-N3)-methyltransferase